MYLSEKERENAQAVGAGGRRRSQLLTEQGG